MARRYLPIIALALVSACASPTGMRLPTATPLIPSATAVAAAGTPTMPPAATITATSINPPSLRTTVSSPTQPGLEPTGPAAAPSITPQQVLFEFDERMTGSEKVSIHQGIEAAIAALGNAGQVTVYANTDIDELR